MSFHIQAKNGTDVAPSTIQMEDFPTRELAQAELEREGLQERFEVAEKGIEEIEETAELPAAPLTDGQFKEKLLAYLGRFSHGHKPIVPLCKNPEGTIKRRETLDLPAFRDLPDDLRKELLS